MFQSLLRLHGMQTDRRWRTELDGGGRHGVGSGDGPGAHLEDRPERRRMDVGDGDGAQDAGGGTVCPAAPDRDAPGPNPIPTSLRGCLG
ncbi:hypothetical protein Hanom_Chr05g00434011 [Helianthus anomalus]